MTAKRIILVGIAVAIVSASIIVFARLRPNPSPITRLEAEREVLATLLADPAYSEVKVFPIAQDTTLGRFEESISLEDFPSTFAGLPQVKRETLFDFQEINSQPYPIQDYLPTNVETTGESQTWWISFSRVGFDSSLTEALVLIEEHLDCHEGNCSYGTGNLVFLQKIDNKWGIQDRFMYWRSHPT